MCARGAGAGGDIPWGPFQEGRCSHSRCSRACRLCARGARGRGGTYHGIHFRKGIALVLVVVEHVVHSPLLGQSTHLVEQLIGSAKVQDGNGAHLLPAAKHLCNPAPGRQHITEAVNHFLQVLQLGF